MVTLGSALQEACLSRLQFCRDVLVLLCVVKSEGMEEVGVRVCEWRRCVCVCGEE